MYTITSSVQTTPGVVSLQSKQYNLKENIRSVKGNIRRSPSLGCAARPTGQSAKFNTTKRNVNLTMNASSKMESWEQKTADANSHYFHYFSRFEPKKQVQPQMTNKPQTFDEPIIYNSVGQSNIGQDVKSIMNKSNPLDFMIKQMNETPEQMKKSNHARNSLYYRVAGTPIDNKETKDDFIDQIFSASSAKKTVKSRPNESMSKQDTIALPKGAEGNWGSVDRNYVIGGNWKSNGDWEFSRIFPNYIHDRAKFDPSKVEVVIAPTNLDLHTVKTQLSRGFIQACAQDVSQYGRGAYTGNVTADQLTDAGINWTLTGHSERRTLFKESDEDVALKTKIAVENGLNVMVCIGELLEERESGKTAEVNARQLQAIVDHLTESQWGNIVIAYEPVWAIGTGKVATLEQAEETHAEIRNWLADAVSPEVAGATRILYGGSVNAKNCAELINNPDIDGFLVGGASLKPEFVDIIKAADDHKKSN